MAPLRVLHVTESFSGGVLDFLKTLTSEMHSMSPNMEVHVAHGIRCDTPDDAKRGFPDSARFYLWNYAQREISPFQDILSLSSLMKLIRKIDPDIIHLHSSKAGFIGRIACRLLRKDNNIRVIYTPHATALLRDDVGRIAYLIYLWAEKIAALVEGEVVACSCSEASVFKENGIAASFINNGVNVDLDVNAVEKNKDVFRVVSVGRAVAQKDPVRFSQIAKRFIKENGNSEFFWIGHGDLSREMAASVEQTGWLKKVELYAYLKSSDVYLSTSRMEGMPLSVIQAMAFGLPLVLTDCAGNRDLVEHGVNGYLFNADQEAIEYLSLLKEDRCLREDMGNRSKDLYFESLTARAMATAYLKKYLS